MQARPGTFSRGITVLRVMASRSASHVALASDRPCARRPHEPKQAEIIDRRALLMSLTWGVLANRAALATDAPPSFKQPSSNSTPAPPSPGPNTGQSESSLSASLDAMQSTVAPQTSPPDASVSPRDAAQDAAPSVGQPASPFTQRPAPGEGQVENKAVIESEEIKKTGDDQEEGKKKVKKKRGRLRELEQIRADLKEKELELLEKESELLGLEQTVSVLREELELERKIRALLTKDKEKAEEQAALAMGLCGGAGFLP